MPADHMLPLCSHFNPALYLQVGRIGKSQPHQRLRIGRQLQQARQVSDVDGLNLDRLRFHPGAVHEA